MNKLDKIIASMKPGQSAEISRCGNVWCTVERSGDGKTLTFVRHNANGFEVFKRCRF